MFQGHYFIYLIFLLSLGAPSINAQSNNKKDKPDEVSPPNLLEGEKVTPAQLPEALRKIRDQIRIRWYPPELFSKLDVANKGVSIAGETKPGTRVYLKSDEIFQFKADGAKVSRKLNPDDAKYLPGVVDLRGLFFFELYLPPGKYDIPVSFVDPRAPMLQAAKNYHLIINIKSDKVEFDYLIEGEDDPFSPISDYFTFGLGGNLMVYNKAVPEIPAELRFSSFKVPSLRMGFGKSFSESWRMASYFLSAPGSTSNGSRVTVTNGNYNWPILSADLIYSHKKWKWLYHENYRIRWGLRMGLQSHLIPFMRAETQGSTVQTIRLASMQMLTVGTQFDILTNADISYEILMRFHFPMNTNDYFKVTNQMSFDGSMGALYRWPEQKWSLGLFWYGQWLKYSFTEYDQFVSREVQGTFNILYSNIEMRFIYPF
jgi:hypothetical protein